MSHSNSNGGEQIEIEIEKKDDETLEASSSVHGMHSTTVTTINTITTTTKVPPSLLDIDDDVLNSGAEG
jgi:hypothetical protein